MTIFTMETKQKIKKIECRFYENSCLNSKWGYCCHRANMDIRVKSTHKMPHKGCSPEFCPLKKEKK